MAVGDGEERGEGRIGGLWRRIVALLLLELLWPVLEGVDR